MNKTKQAVSTIDEALEDGIHLEEIVTEWANDKAEQTQVEAPNVDIDKLKVTVVKNSYRSQSLIPDDSREIKKNVREGSSFTVPKPIDYETTARKNYMKTEIENSSATFNAGASFNLGSDLAGLGVAVGGSESHGKELGMMSAVEQEKKIMIKLPAGTYMDRETIVETPMVQPFTVDICVEGSVKLFFKNHKVSYNKAEHKFEKKEVKTKETKRVSISDKLSNVMSEKSYKLNHVILVKDVFEDLKRQSDLKYRIEDDKVIFEGVKGKHLLWQITTAKEIIDETSKKEISLVTEEAIEQFEAKTEFKLTGTAASELKVGEKSTLHIADAASGYNVVDMNPEDMKELPDIFLKAMAGSIQQAERFQDVNLQSASKIEVSPNSDAQIVGSQAGANLFKLRKENKPAVPVVAEKPAVQTFGSLFANPEKELDDFSKRIWNQLEKEIKGKFKDELAKDKTKLKTIKESCAIQLKKKLAKPELTQLFVDCCKGQEGKIQNTIAGGIAKTIIENWTDLEDIKIRSLDIQDGFTNQQANLSENLVTLNNV